MIKYVGTLLVLSFSPFAYSQLSGLEGQRLSLGNEPRLFETSITYAIARQGQRAVDNTVVVKGFSDADTHVYSLSTKLQLVKTRKVGREAEGYWPVIRWTHTYIEPEIIEKYAQYEIDYTAYPFVFKPEYPLACLNETPLRYGDVDQSGKSELVIILGNELLIFSPVADRVIFGARLRVDDWLNAQDTSYFYLSEEGQPNAKETDPQFPSQITYRYQNSVIKSRLPGYRGYAKLYLDDFNEDGAHDILVWRKLYQSRLRNDDTPGFRHLRETLLHYKLVEGEYQPQDTEQSKIKSWLAAKNLTWQKGYPSKSECPGEEGKLIPEMHDPLLNDPDVLK